MALWRISQWHDRHLDLIRSRMLGTKLWRLSNIIAHIFFGHRRVTVGVLHIRHTREGHLHTALVCVAKVLRRSHVLIIGSEAKCLHIIPLLGKLMYKQRMRE